MYTYDANGNRATKTTAYGTITYTYDAENRLVKTCGDTGVGVEYAYDNNGNLLSQTSSFTTTATVSTAPIPCGSPRWIQSGMVLIGLCM